MSGDETMPFVHGQHNAPQKSLEPISDEDELLKDAIIHDDYDLEEIWESSHREEDFNARTLVVGKCDVLCERHRLRAGNSIGNRRFIATMSIALGKFLEAKTIRDRWVVVHDIVASVQRTGNGRFLRIENGEYVEMTNRQAHELTVCELQRMAKEAAPSRTKFPHRAPSFMIKSNNNTPQPPSAAKKPWSNVTSLATTVSKDPIEYHEENSCLKTGPLVFHPTARSPTGNLSFLESNDAHQISWDEVVRSLDDRTPPTSNFHPTPHAVHDLTVSSKKHERKWDDGDDDLSDIVDLTPDELLKIRKSFVEEHGWPLVKRVKCWLEKGKSPNSMIARGCDQTKRIM